MKKNINKQSRTKEIDVDTKTKLLNVGLELIGQNGIEGTSLREISLKSGQNLASISYHYGDKLGLYSAIIQHVSNEYKSILDALSTEIDERLNLAAFEPEEVINYIKRLLQTLVETSLSKESAFSSGINILLREQIHPTDVFPIVYLNTYLPIQRLIGKLLSVLFKKDPNHQEVVLFSYTLLALSMFYRTNKYNIHKAMGDTSLSKSDTEKIILMVLSQAEVILRAKLNTDQ
ncbi:CerR family C-terminal domain-containing protein [Methylophilus methylotrophus]|uniref:CerR family C-terminal domain-containing protein n=1 Tax=Methylophilus methylotrophus TaxID=17 RepID=UPI0003603AA1|nr:CerR family C-terminal domain-containing protein [Methylophilus methylotrophus]